MEWTLKRMGGTRKSKTQVGAPKRKTRHHICEKNYIKLNIEYNINILDLFKGKNEINILIEYNI